MQAQFGDAVYQLLCAACHGRDGKGDGPFADALNTPPTDLTSLARRNGGTFPAERVIAAIEGRAGLVGHPGLATPPWDQLFADEYKSFPQGTIIKEMIARRIAHIVAYLESIQEE